MPPFEGNRGTKTLLGNKEHKKMFISIFKNMCTTNSYSEEQGISTNLT